MTIEGLRGPWALRYDGPPAAERAIGIALVLVGRRRGLALRVRDADNPTERSFGRRQALTGGRSTRP